MSEAKSTHVHVKTPAGNLIGVSLAAVEGECQTPHEDGSECVCLIVRIEAAPKMAVYLYDDDGAVGTIFVPGHMEVTYAEASE